MGPLALTAVDGKLLNAWWTSMRWAEIIAEFSRGSCCCFKISLKQKESLSTYVRAMADPGGVPGVPEPPKIILK